MQDRFRVVSEPKHLIMPGTQQPTNAPSARLAYVNRAAGVVMIYNQTEWFIWRFATNGATAALFYQHLLISASGNAIAVEHLVQSPCVSVSGAVFAVPTPELAIPPEKLFCFRQLFFTLATDSHATGLNLFRPPSFPLRRRAHQSIEPVGSIFGESKWFSTAYLVASIAKPKAITVSS